MSILRGYLLGALFTESPAGHYAQCDVAEVEEGADISRYFSQDFVASATKDCEEFERQTGEVLLEQAQEFADLEEIGTDFWLTRNGHGAGFWEGDYSEDKYGPDPIGSALTEISKGFGETYCFLGSDLLGPDGDWTENDSEEEE